MSTSPAELDHQEPSPGFGPTFNAPAIGASFQVPSKFGDGGFVWSPIHEPGSKPPGASCAPSPPPESLSIFHSAATQMHCLQLQLQLFQLFHLRTPMQCQLSIFSSFTIKINNIPIRIYNCKIIVTIAICWTTLPILWLGANHTNLK